MKFEYKNYAVIGPESEYAAQATLCAAEQGKFWEYSDKVFREQKGENQGAFSKNNLKQFATDKSLGLDTAAFNSCLDSDRYHDRVIQDTKEGQSKGVRATPTFFLDGEMIEGALPFAEFQKRFDAKLSQKP